MKKVYTFTPKEGAGRSNRLGDANKIRHLQVYLVGAFFMCARHGAWRASAIQSAMVAAW